MQEGTGKLYVAAFFLKQAHEINEPEYVTFITSQHARKLPHSSSKVFADLRRFLFV